MADQKTIENRLAKNYKHLSKWAKRESIEAYRWYERDIPEFPFIVDIYKDHVVLYERFDEEIDNHKKHHLDYTLSAIKNILNCQEDRIIIKSRQRQKGLNQYEKIAQKNEFFIIQEHEAKFLVNLTDYLDTGLFLDHRPMRKTLFESSKDLKVLNLFSYTGSVSVAAALGGARLVTSVDLSSTYQDWAKKNFELNNINLSAHHFITKSALDYLKEAQGQFDLIFLDPPTFSNSKKMDSDFEVEKDQFFLVSNCLKLLSPNGTLFFSNNKRKFKLDQQIANISKVEDISKKTIPLDFRDQKIHHCYMIKHQSK